MGIPGIVVKGKMGCFEDNQLQYKGFQVHLYKTGFMKPNRYRMSDMGPL